jgi:hypothetical protein
MAYNPDLDEYLFSKSWENEWTRLTVSVLSYNKGRKKLQITRQNINTEGQLRLVKLGRLTKQETESILPLIQEALNYMD